MCAPRPFGAAHPLGLALRNGDAPPDWSVLGALLRNLALFPVVLAHGLLRVVRLR